MTTEQKLDAIERLVSTLRFMLAKPTSDHVPELAEHFTDLENAAIDAEQSVISMKRVMNESLHT